MQELIRWIETNKLMKYESEGRDADMDRIIESHVSENPKEDEQEGDSTQEQEKAKL